MLDWFNGLFRPDDHLCANEACKWPIVHCHYCQDIHINGLEKEDEEVEWQKEQRAFRKKMRRMDNLKARRIWLTRLRPRPSKIKWTLPDPDILSGTPSKGGVRPTFCKSQWSILRVFKKELLFIYWVGRVEPGLACSACRCLGIDLTDEWASRCDRDGLAGLVGCVRGDSRQRSCIDRAIDCDDTRHSWRGLFSALEERVELLSAFLVNQGLRW